MTILGAGLTDIGYKRRQNEDALLCDNASGLFIVADGMGGRAAGGTASKAVTTLVPLILQEKFDAHHTLTPELIMRALRETLCQLSRDLYQQSQEIPEVRGLGSTIALVLFVNSIAYVACAGDSRVYLMRNKRMMQVSEDQTVAASLIKAGHLSPETAELHPLRHALEEYIGKEDLLHPGIWQKALHVNDRWLLCSDGLTKGLSEQRLYPFLLESSPPEDVCHLLISAAKQQDGTDNITAIVVDIISL